MESLNSNMGNCSHVVYNNIIIFVLMLNEFYFVARSSPKSSWNAVTYKAKSTH